MLGTTIGAYRIEEVLGSGGMGTVYRASLVEEIPGHEPGETVALKVIHPHLLSWPGYFRRFLREAEAGRAVRHPNVVRAYDVDVVHDGDQLQGVLAMEFVEGKTLRRLMRDLGTVPEALLREIADQVAAGLVAIHEEGIVHRDLKPDNVLITADHQVKIMDLGVARILDESAAITKEGQFAGSAFYAAPEQFGKDEVGPSADLYSLGVVLYELASGENPFLRENALKVMTAHLSETPRRVTEIRPELSPFLADVLATLLRKAPADRFESAAALLDVFERGEESDWWADRVKRLVARPPRVPRVPVRRDTRVYGREEETEELDRLWRKAEAGEGGIVLVEGEAGIGKSRLVDAFLSTFEDRDAHVLYGSYQPSGGIGGLSDAILSHLGRGSLEERLGRYLESTPLLAPAFAAMVRHETPPPGSEAMRSDALHAVFVHLMRGLAEEKPVIWVVEDLHFAEPASRKIALSMARAVEGKPILLLATARPEIPADELAHFSRLPGYRKLPLKRLGARQVIELLRDAFQSRSLADKLGGKVAYKSDGVPFFVFEIVRGLKDGHFIEELPDGSYIDSKIIDEIEVPSSVRDLIEGRLGDLSREERAVLDVAAVLGFEFETDLVARVLERRRIAVLQDLAEVERRSGVVRSGGSGYRFDHHQIQEVLYRDLPAELRAEYHATLAEQFARREAPRTQEELPGESAFFLARHHLLGSRPAEGLPSLLPSLDHLAASFRPEAAADLAFRALESPGLLEGRIRFEVLMRQSGRLNILGRREEEAAALGEASRLAEIEDDLLLIARAANSTGRHHLDVSRLDEAADNLDRALDFARRAGDRGLEASTLGNLGKVRKNQGRFEEALRHHRDSLEIARECGNSMEEGVAAGNIGIVLFRLGRHDEAKEHLERDLAIVRELGDRAGEASAIGNLGLILSSRGSYAEALDCYELSLVRAREIGDRRFESIALSNVGYVLQTLGRFEKALNHYEQALHIDREIGYGLHEATMAGNMGAVVSDLGRVGEAFQLFEEYLDLTRAVGNALGETRAHLNLAEILVRLGDIRSAREHAQTAIEMARKLGSRYEEGYGLKALGEAVIEGGDAAEAESHLSAALSLLRSIPAPPEVAETLVDLARILAETGRAGDAGKHLEEGRRIAAEAGSPGIEVLACCHLAVLDSGRLDTAVQALSRKEDSLTHRERMECRFLLYRATGEAAHLGEARRLLAGMLAHAPEDRRGPMIENVRLHREIGTEAGTFHD